MGRRAILILLVLSAAVNLVQAYRIRDLSVRIEVFKGEQRLRPGTVVTALAALTRSGERVDVVPPSGGALLIYWMSPDCAWCLRTEANARALLSAARGRMRVVVMTPSIDRAKAFDAQSRLGEPILGEPDAATAKALRLGGTPMTIVVSSDGRVENVWTGAYLAGIKDEIEARFGLALPGLSEATGK